MSKAEDRYLEYFQDGRLINCSSKESFLLGYHQAEKDLELSWEDIQKIDFLIYAVLDEEKYKRYYTQDRDGNFYKEVLKRLKDFKERKEKCQ